MSGWKLPLRNLTRKAGRTAALVLLVAFQALAVFGGSTVILSLRSGLNSLQNRMGADIIVIPASARSRVDPESLFLQGTTGYFYMGRDKMAKLETVEGVERMSPQLFLASLRASCCSLPIQVIGLDQETDFTVQPWIAESYQQQLGLKDVVAGSKVSAAVGESIRIYDENCRVVGKLSETGTGLDTAVYCSMETLQHLLDAAREKGHDLQISGDSADWVSAVYLKVKDGCSPEQVAADINLHVRKVEAIQTRNMFSSVSDSLRSVSRVVGWLIGAVWALALVILLVVFAMMIHERKREFAVLRLLGMSRRMLGGMVVKEALCCGLAGGVLGTALGLLILIPFTGLIEQSLGLPYLMPGAGTLAILGAGAVGLCAAICMAASLSAARRLSRVDTGTVLREGN